MTLKEAKETVVLAGKRLVESGLIARTWGNVSCRVSSSHFVITPSGRDYLSLAPEEIVEVSIADCSYSGNIKPSSEKGVHAEVYKHHPEINFVIHTHQDLASCVSVLGMGLIKVSEEYPTLHGEVICAAYGLPGTKKLRKGIADALTVSKGNAIIMKNHGALCYGKSYEEAFLVAQELENACRQYIHDRYRKISNLTIIDPIEVGCFALTTFTGKKVSVKANPPVIPYESERTKEGFQIKIDEKTFHVSLNRLVDISAIDQTLYEEAILHNEIYNQYKEINYIIHSETSGITAVSCAGIKVRPLLDDFAQIAGTSVKTVDALAPIVSDALKKSSTVFLKNQGALCCGSTREDAHAVSIVTEKNSNALISAALFGKVKYINHLECLLMRLVYLKKYSKQAINNK